MCDLGGPTAWREPLEPVGPGPDGDVAVWCFGERGDAPVPPDIAHRSSVTCSGQLAGIVRTVVADEEVSLAVEGQPALIDGLTLPLSRGEPVRGQ